MKYPNDYFHIPKWIYFCDIETTGFDYWRNEILTLSISRHDYASLELDDELELTFKPSNLQHFGGSEVHGFSISDTLEFEDKSESTSKLIEFFENTNCEHNVFCCHALWRYNTFFDWAFLLVHMIKFKTEYFLRNHLNKLESTVNYFKHLQKNGLISVENFKLNTLCNHFKIALDHHDAKSDRVACFELYKIARGF